jgi:hypothetical protein
VGPAGYKPPEKPWTFPVKGCLVEAAKCAEAGENIIEWRTKGHYDLAMELEKPKKVVSVGGKDKREPPKAILDGTMHLMKCAIPYAEHCKADPAWIETNKKQLSSLEDVVKTQAQSSNGAYWFEPEVGQNLMIDKDVSLNTALAVLHELGLSLITTSGTYGGCHIGPKITPKHMAYCQGVEPYWGKMEGSETIHYKLGLHHAVIWIADTGEPKGPVKLDYWDTEGAGAGSSNEFRVAGVKKMLDLGLKCPIHQDTHVQCELSDNDLRQKLYLRRP